MFISSWVTDLMQAGRNYTKRYFVRLAKLSESLKTREEHLT